MNGNSSKQVLLSVLGIAVLVVAVVGVSFAFFTYSKNGGTNNYVTTGTIIFNFTETNSIALTNQFPVADSEGGNITKVAGAGNVLSFSLAATNTSTSAINYTVTAHAGTLPDNTNYKGTVSGFSYDEADRFFDNEIKIKLTGKNGAALPSSENSVVTTSYGTGDYVSSKSDNTDTKSAAGVTIATGTLTGTITQDFELRMWIPSDRVTIANTTSEANHVYSSTDFAKKFYSLRVDVSANAAASNVAP